jgi:crotonobetainyl-CoA:carnitine CoA-transferase CaiB-like acyl-CoA transferase/tripartite-type tricarboxylate transporter receptor subunit TctC
MNTTASQQQEEPREKSISQLPLSGVRVLDLSRVLAGPFCAQMLGDFGADVIKVEPPAGDQGRTSGPPLIEGESAMFHGLNRNKRGISLDMSTSCGREVFLRLLADADVVVENFKPGTLENWGLSYADLKMDFPRLIMVSITGFGADGPLGGTPGYDGSAGAWTGVIAANGSEETGPMRLGISVVDVSTGLHSVIGVLLALRARDQNGRGQHLDMSLFDCAFPLLNPHVANWLQGDERTPRTGNQHPTFTPMGLYPTADNPIYLAVSTEKNFASLCKILGRHDWLEDRRFADMTARLSHRDELIALVTKAFASEHAEDLAMRLNAAGIPAGAVLHVADALAHPHTRHRKMLIEANGFRTLGLPVKLSATPGKIRCAPPTFGQHTEEILLQAGFPASEIKELQNKGIAPRERSGKFKPLNPTKKEITDMSIIKRQVTIGAIASLTALVALTTLTAPTTSFAQTYTNKPLTLVVPFAAGGTADMIARKIAPKLTEKYKVPVIVDNKPGAGGAIGNRIVATAPGDGHTLLIASAGITTEPALRKNSQYNMQTDLAAVTKLVTMPNVVVVNADVKAQTLADLIAYAKANPGKLTVGSSGNGSSTHFSAELLKATAEIDMVHVPYKGGAPSWQAIMGGEINVLVDPISNARKLVESKKVRALALAAPRRTAYWPTLPTAAEAGLPGYEVDMWFGVFASSKTPPALVKEIQETFRQIMAEPDFKAWAADIGFTIVGNTPHEFAATNAEEVKRWTELVRVNKIPTE